MSWIRQIKTLAALDISIIIFSAWVAATNLLFTNIVDYKLFFLLLISVFLMQYVYIKKSNKYIAVILPVTVSLPFLLILFHGMLILVNLFLIVISVVISLAVEEFPVEYEEYKIKAEQGALILILITLISLGLSRSIADYLYRFFINYTIITIILLREIRAYCFKITLEDKNTKNILKNAVLKYGIATTSTVILSTDWILDKSLYVLSILNTGADIVLGGILETVGLIVAPVIQKSTSLLQKLLIGVGFTGNFEQLSKGLNKITKNTDFKKGGATAAENTLVFTTIKIVLLFLVILFIIDTVEKIKRLKSKNAKYTEEKEKINKLSKAGRVNKKYVQSLLRKLLTRNNTVRDKILNTYRDFERITNKAEIFDPCMTATQLKTRTKTQIKNESYLDDMTDIYNEVKFSNKTAQDNQLDLMKKAVDSVKQQL